MSFVEIKTLINIWTTATISLIYCHQITARIPSGVKRLLSVLPVLYLFTTLPLNLTTFHLSSFTIFYLVWLGNFKLLLFSFNQGPLSLSTSPLSLFHFISIALLPIKVNPSPTKHTLSQKIFKVPVHILVKAGLEGVIFILYSMYRDYFIHPYSILLLQCSHLYLGLELVLAITAAPVQAMFGYSMEPQFNEPYLTTSLQDFWGYRWNLMVTSILRPSVYLPVRHICTRILGRRAWALPPAVFATFLVSGLMHELLYYYLTRANPTWEVTWFFILHGVFVVAEIGIKKVVGGRFRLHRVVSGVATLAFMVVTCHWLFFPQLIRNGMDTKAINEYYVLFNFLFLNYIGIN